MNDFEKIKLYIVRNQDGLYFSKSFNSHRGIWDKDVSKAKIYSKLSHARSIFTLFSRKEGKPCTILELSVGKVIELDERYRIERYKDKTNEEV